MISMSVPFDEVAQQPEPRRVAFFRMKLHREQVVPGQRRVGAHTVVDTARHQGTICGMHIVAVHEIETLAVLDALPQGVRGALVHAVPAHVRHLQARTVRRRERRAEMTHLAVDKPQAVHAAVFLGAVEQGLHSDTDRQHRLVLLTQRRVEEFVTVQAADLRHAVADGAHAGKYDPVRGAQPLGVAGHLDTAGAHVRQGTGHGVQVAHAVIDDGDAAAHECRAPACERRLRVRPWSTA
jgi:hypothetical protein